MSLCRARLPLLETPAGEEEGRAGLGQGLGTHSLWAALGFRRPQSDSETAASPGCSSSVACPQRSQRTAGMCQREDDASSDVSSDDDDDDDDDRSPDGEEALSPPSAGSSSRLPPPDLSLSETAHTNFELDSDDDRDGMELEWEVQLQNTQFYQHVMSLYEDRKPQNTIQDNMESYRKMLSLGIQLAEDSHHSHMTQGHSAWANGDACPSTSQGLQTVPEAIKSAPRQGVCDDESSCGMIMENLIKEMSCGSEEGGVGESSEELQEFSDDSESVIQGRGLEENSLGGDCRVTSDLVPGKKVAERKRRHLDTDGEDLVPDHGGCAGKEPSECGAETQATGVSSLGSFSCSSVSEAQPVDFGEMPYMCEECGRSFGVISEFVEHQIMHTRENLYEYGESFIHSAAVSEVQRRGGKCFECKQCRAIFGQSSALAEHWRIHAREYFKECQDQGSEGTEMFSPTFSELQKMYGKNKFYACRVCKETFLHSSALMEHEKTHARGNLAHDRGGECSHERECQCRESLVPGPTLLGSQKMCGTEKTYECEVCGESFLHSSPLEEHQKTHMRGNLFENKSTVCEETSVAGPTLRRWQKTDPQERLLDFNDGRDVSVQSPDLSEHQKIHSRKIFSAGRGCEKPAIHTGPLLESQKSRTVSRPPEDEDEEDVIIISTSVHEDCKFPKAGSVLERKPYEKSVILCLASADTQKRSSTEGLEAPKLTAASPLQSSDVINRQKVCAEGDACAGKGYKRPIVHGLAAPTPLKRRRGNEQVECGEKGESAMYISDLNSKWQKVPTREDPCEGEKNNSYQGSVIQSAPSARLQRSLAGGGAGEFQQNGRFTVLSSNVHERRLCAKMKPTEPRSNETSVIHSLPSGELPTACPREKPCAGQGCGEPFAGSPDLPEHQKIHSRAEPSGSGSYERSAIHSFSPAAPGPSHAQELCAEEPVHPKPRELAWGCALSISLGAHQMAEARGQPHGERGGQETHEVTAAGALESDDPRQDRGRDFADGPKDEGLESGHRPSRASILTGPFRKPVPFPECQDCGQPLDPDALLTGHHQLYPEEAATAQDAEADVLVPQEALQIQGSNADAAEPGTEVAEPGAEAAEASGEAEGPEEEAAERNGEAQPPSGDADGPDGAAGEDPEESPGEPAGDADEPDGVGIEDPEEGEDDPEIQVKGSYYSCPECAEIFLCSVAFGEHLRTHARVVILEPANALGESSGRIERAQQATEKSLRCGVCGQPSSDRLSLARHQNTHRRECRGWRVFT